MNNKKIYFSFTILSIFWSFICLGKSFSINICECVDSKNKPYSINIYEVIAKMKNIDISKNLNSHLKTRLPFTDDIFLKKLISNEDFPDPRAQGEFTGNDYKLISSNLTIFNYCKEEEKLEIGAKCQEKAILSSYFDSFWRQARFEENRVYAYNLMSIYAFKYYYNKENKISAPTMDEVYSIYPYILLAKTEEEKIQLIKNFIRSDTKKINEKETNKIFQVFGGGSCVKETNGKIEDAFIFDIATNKKYLKNDVNVRALLKEMKFLYQQYWNDFLENIEHMKTNTVLTNNYQTFMFSEDVAEDNCAVYSENYHYEQLALYSDYYDKLYINQKIFSKLSETDKQLLFIHEALYKLFRQIRGPSNVNLIDVSKIISTLIDVLHPPSKYNLPIVRPFPFISTEVNNNQCKINGLNKIENLASFPCKSISEFDSFDLAYVTLPNNKRMFINGKFQVVEKPPLFDGYKTFGGKKECNWVNEKNELLYNKKNTIFNCTEFVDGYAYFSESYAKDIGSNLNNYKIFKIDRNGNISVSEDASNSYMNARETYYQLLFEYQVNTLQELVKKVL